MASRGVHMTYVPVDILKTKRLATRDPFYELGKDAIRGS